MLADTAGRDGIFCILAGILSTFLYLKLLRYLLKGMKTSYPDFLEQNCGKICGYVLWGWIFFCTLSSWLRTRRICFHADVKWSCGKRQLLSGAVVDITARILWNGRWNRGQGKSVRDTVLVSDDTAVSDVVCGMQGGKACLLEPGFVADGKKC